MLLALGCARMMLSRGDDELLLCTLVKSVRIDLQSRGYGCNSIFELHLGDAGRRLCSSSFLIHASTGVSWTTLDDVGSVRSIFFFLLLFRALRSAML